MNDYKKYATSGFTYAELLLALMTAGMIMMILPSILSLFQSIELHDDTYDIDIFTMDIIETYSESNEIKMTSATRLNFTTERGIVSYRYNNGRIIKSIDNAGFVTLMFNVDTYTLHEAKESITVQLKGEVDETFTFKK